MTTKPTAAMTLAEALEHTYRTRWAHARDGGKCLYSQGKAAIDGLWDAVSDGSAVIPLRVGEILPWVVQKATSQWYAEGLSPATITKRLNCLSAMGIAVSGMRPPKERNLKWWLRPEEEKKAMRLLTTEDLGLSPHAINALCAHIAWTTKTGLRVEETLRLTEANFGNRTVLVPGVKTATSQAELPLSDNAWWTHFDVLAYRLSYGDLEAAWRKLRAAMGWPQAATLKALRRSAARYLHVDCGMPLHMVQQYLRHENINTTLDYLRLTGGYNTEEMRRYLK